MTEKINKITQIILVILLVICLIISLGVNIYYTINPNDIIQTKTEYKEKIITIHDTVPMIKNNKLITVITDTVNHVTVNHDTVQIEALIPITQKEYSDDSTYTAWVSGYQQKLDSIHTYQKIIEKTITVTPKKTFWSHFNAGVGVYSGYGFFNKKPDVFVGIGVQYNF